MRNYQFKTINPQIGKAGPMVRNNPVYSPPPQNSISFRIEQPPTVNQSRVTMQGQATQAQPMGPAASQYGASSDSNILNMKRQLEMLVKQTDYIQRTKNISTYENNQGYAAGRSLSSNSKFNVREIPDSSDKLKNYQKYQNYLQQPIPLNQNLNAGFQLKNNIINPPTPATVGYETKNRSYTSFPIKPNDERKKMRALNQFQDTSMHVKTQPAEKTQIVSERLISFANRSPIQPKAQNPERSYAQQNYSSLRPKTEGIEEKNSVQLQRKPNFEQTYFSPNNRTNFSPIQYKQQQISYKSPVVRQSYENQYRPSPRTQTQRTESKQLESNLAELQKKLKTMEEENQKLKEGLKATSENKDFYRSELQSEREKIIKIQKDYNSKILLLKQELEKERQSDRVKQSNEIQSIKKAFENEKIKINQIHNIQLAKAKENEQTAVEQAQKALKAQINLLKEQIKSNKSNVVNLIKQIKDQEEVGQTQSDLEKSNDLNNLYSQLAQKEYTISQLHGELNSRTQHIEMLNETFSDLKNQLQELKSFKNKVEVEKFENFDQILLSQMQAINELKNTVQSLNERLNEAKLSLIEANRTNESLENDIKIMQFKHKAEVNMIRTQSQIEISNRDNTISTLNKKMQTIEDKLRFATNDIKTKDEFVKQYLVGRSGTPEAKDHVEEILKKYQQTFSESNEQKLRVELEKARKQIQLYEKYA